VLPDGSFVATLVGGGAEDATLPLQQRNRNAARVGEVHVVLNFLEALRGRRAR
jgi:hypothetical protein